MTIIPKSQRVPRAVWEAERKRDREDAEWWKSYCEKLDAAEGAKPVEGECVLCGCVMDGDSGVCSSCYIAFAKQGGDW